MHATSTRTDETGSNDSNPPLEAVDLEHSFGSVSVLEGTSLSLPGGTVTALIGPNGTGKSTLLRILIGAIEQDAGSVVYRGPAVPRPIGYLPQRPAFRPGFSVGETLSFYARLVGERDPDVQETLERVGLDEARGTRVEALSGGMTRLLGLAQATIGSPPVIVLDEPASGLDPGMRTRVYEVATDLAADDAAVLVTTHALALAKRHADRVALLDGGRIQVAGTPAQICADSTVDSLRDAYERHTTSDERAVTVRRIEQ